MGERILVTVLQTENLEKNYMLGNIPVHALRGVNLEVAEGDFVAILGPSGSGKSTLLNLLGALDTPSAGSVRIGNSDVSVLNDSELALLRRRIGIVFQFFNLVSRLTARENVELPLSIANIPRSKRRKIAEDLLEMVGLKDRMTHKPSELSGGERQRVAIARALASKPQFLLMDEPTGNIDSKTAKELMTLVKDLNTKHGMTIVMVTHDRTMAKYATRVLELLDGQIKKEARK
jgi:putative ABC transport system ATP-binding protein